MKATIFLRLVIVLALFGCRKDSNTNIVTQELESAGGFGLYWDHEIFGTDGRCVRFEFSDTKRLSNYYTLKFDYTIKGHDLLIRLISKADQGKCPHYPGESDTLCTSKGLLSIPDNLLQKGTYNMTLKTSNFEVKSELLVDDEKITLTIPTNDYFRCAIKTVYPIPANLLMAQVVYSGSQNTVSANSFFNDLKAFGLTERKLPNYRYRHLEVDESGNAINSDWPPDNHLLAFNYNMNRSFKEIFNLAKEDFNKYNINIYLSSSNGDEARLTKMDGIIVHYAGEEY